MMLFHLEFADIIGLALTELFQTVGGLFNGFMSICSNRLAIECVHAVYICFMQCSSIVTAKLFKFIRHAIVDVAIANIIW